MPNFIKTTGRGLTQLKHRSVKSAGAGTKRACFKVLAAARQAGFSFAAGVATPSDIEAGLEQQLRGRVVRKDLQNPPRTKKKSRA